MSAEQNLNPQDLELLSAYLDNMLNDAERSALEARLANNEQLHTELEALRATVALIKGLPTLKAPRNFMLTPEMVKSRTEAGAPQMVKSRTETGAPKMVKSKTETGTPQMVKSKTESGRVIRFPISSVMSAAASFVFIIVGMILVFSSLNKPNSASSPATGSNVALMSTIIVPQQESQAEITNDERAFDRTDDVEQEAPDGVNAQRVMMTPTLNPTMAGVMAMPTASQEPLLEVSVESAPSNMPIPPSIDAYLMQTQQAYAAVPAENLTSTETSSDVMMVVPMPTMSLTELPVAVMSVGAGIGDVTEEVIMDTAMTITSEETTPVTGFFEILGNAIPPSPSSTNLAETTSFAVPSQTQLPTPTLTQTIIASEPATKIEEPVSVPTDIAPFIGIGLLAIGIILLVLVVWQGVRGRVS